jgi:CheY-like chemotaxis protein
MPGSSCRKRIVVADDNQDFREMLGLALEARGHEARLASDASEAFAMIQQGPCDLVVTDIVMHGGPTGLELIDRISAELPPPPPPIIASSGFSEVESEALRRGAWAFLHKPFALKDLHLTVERAFADAKPTSQMARRMAERSRIFRARADREAEAFLERIGQRRGDLQKRARWSARWVCDYFGFSGAAFVVLRKGRIEVGASNNEQLLAPGQAIDDRLPFCRDVLESGSSIVLPDVKRFCVFASRCDELPVRFFAAVPLLAPNGIGIGALCVFDERPLQFSAEDLAILEYLGRSSSAALGEAAGGSAVSPFFSAESLLSMESFVGLFALELRRARQHAGSLELAVVGLARKSRDGAWLEAIGRLGRGRRRALGDLGAERLAVYFAAPRRKTATDELHTALAALDEAAVLRGAGVVTSLGDVATALGEREMLRMAEALFRRAEASPGTTERLMIRSEHSRLGWELPS